MISNSKEKKLLLMNNLLIAILIALRLVVAGWLLLMIGLIVIMPITILHIISTNKGFRNYKKLTDNGKFFLYMSLYSFIVFILFQYEMDDRNGFMIFEALIRKLFIEYHNVWQDNYNVSLTITLISGIVIIISDIYILVILRRKDNIIDT